MFEVRLEQIKVICLHGSKGNRQLLGDFLAYDCGMCKAGQREKAC